MLYRDFFEFMPPLPFLIVQGWTHLFGEGFVVLRVLAVGTVVLVGALTYLVVARASGLRVLAAALATGYLLSSQGDWTVINHRWFAIAFALAGLYFALHVFEPRRAVPRASAGAAGLCIGAAVAVTPTMGLVAVAVFVGLAWARRPVTELGAFALAACVAPAACIAFLAANHALPDVVACVVETLITRYANIQTLPFGHDCNAQSLLVVALFPAALAAFGLRLVFAPRAVDARLRMLALVAVAAFVYVHPRADVPHIAFGAPLAAPLLAVCVADLRALGGSRRGRLVLRWAAGLAAGALLTTSLAGWCALAAATQALPLTATPAGQVRFGSGAGGTDLTSLVAALAAVPAGDQVTFYPHDPMLIVLTERRHMAPLDIFTPGLTTSEQYLHGCEAVLTSSDWVVVDRLWADPGHLHRTWPAMSDPSPPEKRALESALDAGFDVVHAEGRFELRRRRQDASRTACRTRELRATVP